MHSRVSRIIKIIAIVIWVLGFIVGIVMGSAGVSLYSYGSDFNGWIMILYWIIFFIMGVFYYAFGELVENVAALRNETSQQLGQMSGVMAQMANLMQARLPAAPAAPASPSAQPAAPRPAEYSRQAAELSCPACGGVIPSGEKACPWCGAAQPGMSSAPSAQSSGDNAQAPEGTVYHKSEIRHVNEFTLVCPYCGREQRADRSVCFRCGAKFLG